MTSKTPVHLFQSHKVDLLSRVGGTESRLEKKEHETQAGPDVDKEHVSWLNSNVFDTFFFYA